jgi:hypothetical protein
MAEWLKAAVLKTVSAIPASCTIRSQTLCPSAICSRFYLHPGSFVFTGFDGVAVTKV